MSHNVSCATTLQVFIYPDGSVAPEYKDIIPCVVKIKKEGIRIIPPKK